MKIPVATAALLAILLQSVAARAETVARTIGGVNFNFALPKGQCLLEDSNPYDAQFIGNIARLFQGSRITVIVSTVECTRLAAMRKGETDRILNYAIYYVLNAFVQSTLPGETQSLRKSRCAEKRKVAKAPLAARVKDFIAAKAKEMGTNIGAVSVSVIGVIGEDAHGCYAATLANVKGEDGKTVLMSSVMGSTVSHRKPLALAIYHPYEGPETTQAGVAAAKATLAEFDKKNP